MSPLSFSITAAICTAALLVAPGAADVLINALIGISAVLLMRSALRDLDVARLLGMPPVRFWAQLAVMRIPGRRRQPEGITQIVEAYGLTPGEVSTMTPDGRMAERDRIEALLRDMQHLGRVRPVRPLLPDHGKLRLALAARAGAGAVSYASIFDAASLALSEAAWSENPATAAA